MRWSTTMTALGALILMPGLANDLRAESLKDAVEDAIAYHPQIYRDQARSVAADHSVEEAYSGFLPTVDLEASSGVEATNSPTTRVAGRGTVGLVRTEASATLRQLLFDFHETRNRVAGAKSRLTASNADLQASGNAIARLASQLYFDLLETRERAVFAEDNVSDLAEIVDLIRGRASAGRAAEADLDQAVSRLALAQADLIAIQGLEREATSRYIENVGHPPGPVERPDEPDYPEANDLDAALATSMDQNPVAHATANRWDASKSDIEVARAEFFPEFAVESSLEWGENLDGVRGDNTSLNLLLTMNWNIFNGFGDLARTRSATAQANAASRTDAEARRVIREAVRIAFRDLQTSKDRLPPLRDDTLSSQKTFDSYLEQFNVGQRSLLDLLDARDELFGAQESEVAGTYDIYQAHYDLLFATGLIMESLGIYVFQETGQFQEVYEQEASFGPATEIETAAVPEAAQVSFAEADWSGEVVLPGAGEFGSWLGEEGQRTIAYVPEDDTAAPSAAASAVALQTGGEATPRDIVGFVVESVPAMGDLPEADVLELPAVAVGGPDDLNNTAEGDGAIPDQDAGIDSSATESGAPGVEEANPDVGGTEDSASVGNREDAG